MTNRLCRGAPLRLMARPTASSLPYEAAVSISPIARLDRIDDTPFALLQVGHLEDAEPQNWHLQAIV